MCNIRELQYFLNTLSSPIDTVEIDSSLVFYDIMEGRSPFERLNSTLVAIGKAYKQKKTIYLYWQNLREGSTYSLEMMCCENFDRLQLEG